MEVSRFEPDVLAEQPALVIWQVGTNAVFRQEEFNPDDVWSPLPRVCAG